MAAEGVGAVERRHFADVCQIGQSHHLEVPLTARAGDAIFRGFLAAHERVYGHATAMPAKIVNLRAVHSAVAGTVAHQAVAEAASGTPAIRAIHLASGPVAAAIWPRSAFTPEARVAGPAIVEQADTTTLAGPRWTARLDPGDCLILERA